MSVWRQLEYPPVGWLEQLGQECVTCGGLLKSLFTDFRFADRIPEFFYSYVIRALPLLAIVSLFAGAVSAWQAHYQFQGNLPDLYLGSVVFKAVVIELTPVMTGLIVAGRAGAAIAAEIASLKLQEQVDSLWTMRVSPFSFLGVPRVMALFLGMPLLVIYADFFGFLGGYLTGVNLLGISTASFWSEIPAHFHLWDVAAGFIKAQVFACVVSVVAVNAGMTAARTSSGVGAATVRSFVTSAVYVLIFNFMVAVLLF